jgi:hypothetical protein
MINDCSKYSIAINAKGQPFPIESLIMALLLSQQKNDRLANTSKLLVSYDSFHFALFLYSLF